MLIIVIVTVVSIGIVLSLLNSVKPPRTWGDVVSTPGHLVVHDGDGDGIATLTATTLAVIVTDSNGDRIAGAAVTLSGNGITGEGGVPPFELTDGDGTARFDHLAMEIVGATNPVTLLVQKSGLGKTSVTVPVIRQ